ncbi:MAG TPA: helical backbone metal receptor [Syntrophorhabdaceae bacterium]|jgi:iron complex transport system substrate-binding protein|nr:ABC transporter substrate-binding protein [Syntrophorhabdaceae bacterium]MDI9562256.1 helical backbone metal receptor [Pseudomonadota bacterium]HOS59757.1 helical backbone metal receptor [Syntrophorhabdaceae bacterium]HQI56061.1 helical backbone metal receptor [Syntrophorhabdaceae bacterium]
MELFEKRQPVKPVKINIYAIIITCLLMVAITGSFSANRAFGSPSNNLGIISLSPVITEGLYLLGMGDNIIGVTIYCQRPSQAKDKQKVGSVVDVNVEKIVNLKPDIVFAMSHTNTKDIKKLRDTGINVITFDIPKTFERLCEIFLALGKTIGKEKEAIHIVNASKRKVSDIRKKTSGLQKQKVFIQIGAKPLFAATDDSFVNDYIEFSGGINIFKDAGSGLISREEVLKRNPDIILIATMGVAGKDEQKIWHRYKMINAVWNNRIYLVDPYRICSPTPVSFAEYLTTEIVGKIQPGIVK